MLESIKNGDQQAFRDFYLLWESRIYTYFLNKTNDYVQTQELTQNTFIKVWEYRSSLSDQHALETQLFRKAKLIYIDWLRKDATQKKRKLAEETFANSPVLQTVNTAYSSTSLPDKIEKALNRLPPVRQEVIRLSHVQGYGYKEIAHKLHISEKTVDNHIHKALKQLRSILQAVTFIF